jgi:uncharacterized protein (TIGR02453 family)
MHAHATWPAVREDVSMSAPDRFRGWPADALAFYDELAANNTRVWWLANKARFDANVRGPMVALADEVRDEFGPLHIFRPNRDTRFAKDKTPYKSHMAAVTEGEGGTSYYVQLGADGLFIGAGYYHLATDQLTRYRAAVAAETGVEFAAAVAAARRSGYTVGGDSLKTAPRGYAKDHPRVELLRHKGIYTGRQFTPAKWLATAAALDRITGAWRACTPFLRWLDTHVGPSELPPEDHG